MSEGFLPPYYVIAESAHEIQNPTSEEKAHASGFIAATIGGVEPVFDH